MKGGMKSTSRVLLTVLAALTWIQSTLAQTKCANTPNYFEPLMDGDGQRYPLAIGPVIWHLLAVRGESQAQTVTYGNV